MLLKDSFKFLISDGITCRNIVSRNQCFNLFLGNILSQLFECDDHLVRSDLTGALNIEHREYSSVFCIVKEIRCVNGSCEELRVIDFAVACVIQLLNKCLHLIFVKIDIVIVVNVFFQFLRGDEASTVLVKLLELLF